MVINRATIQFWFRVPGSILHQARGPFFVSHFPNALIGQPLPQINHSILLKTSSRDPQLTSCFSPHHRSLLTASRPSQLICHYSPPLILHPSPLIPHPSPPLAARCFLFTAARPSSFVPHLPSPLAARRFPFTATRPSSLTSPRHSQLTTLAANRCSSLAASFPSSPFWSLG